MAAQSHEHLADLQRESSPIHLELNIECEQPHCHSSSVAIQVVAITQDGEEPLAVIVAQPVVKDDREAQTEA